LKIFVRFRNETHWKFEVIYQFEGINSSSFEVQLPIGNCLDLFVEIRDYLDGITRFNLSSITVTKEAFSGLLSSNLNQNGIPLTTISVSSLFTQVNLQNEKPTNKSARFEFLKEIKEQANLREDLIKSLSLVQLTNSTD